MRSPPTHFTATCLALESRTCRPTKPQSRIPSTAASRPRIQDRFRGPQGPHAEPQDRRAPGSRTPAASPPDDLPRVPCGAQRGTLPGEQARPCTAPSPGHGPTSSGGEPAPLPGQPKTPPDLHPAGRRRGPGPEETRVRARENPAGGARGAADLGTGRKGAWSGVAWRLEVWLRRGTGSRA